MSRAPLVFTILSIVVSAGCLSPTTSPGDAPTETPDGTSGLGPAEIPWGMSDCRFAIAFVPAPKEKLQVLLPEGFAPTFPPAVAAQLPPDPRWDGVVGIELFACANGIGMDGSALGETQYGSIWTFVEPPPALKDPTVELHFFKWDMLVSDEDLRTALQGMGVAAHAGSAVFMDAPAGDGAGPLTGVLTLDDTHEYGFHGVVGKPEDFKATFVEFSSATSGLVKYRAAVEAKVALSGTGYVELDPDGVPMQVLGTDRPQAYFLSGSGLAFTNATISW
jgi:hypothetical protein